MPRKSPLNDEQLIHDSMQAIRDIPGARIAFMTQKTGGPFAGTFRLSGPWGDFYFYLKVVPRLTPLVLDLVIHQLKTSAAPQDAHPLLVSHYIPPGLAARLRQQQIEFVDCAGNLHLRQLPLYIDISGRKHARQAPPEGRLFRPAGLKLIYLLLRNRNALNATYRALAEDAGIALGAIGSLFKELEKRGNLKIDDQRRRQLVATEELLQRWQLGYLEALRPRLLLQRCAPAANQPLHSLPDAIRGLANSRQVLIGGELAAAQLLSGFQPQSAVLYLDREQQLKTMLQLHLTPDPHGTITLLQSFGRQCGWSGWQPPGLSLADPLLTFAELQGEHTDRAAEQLYQRYLAPRLVD